MGNLATRNDSDSPPPGVGVTHCGSTEDDDDDKDEGMGDVWEWLRQTTMVVLHDELGEHGSSRSGSTSGSWSDSDVDASSRTWNTPEQDIWTYSKLITSAKLDMRWQRCHFAHSIKRSDEVGKRLIKTLPQFTTNRTYYLCTLQSRSLSN